jgi:prepilin-type N-terminal cleavage/methylation domain-containing protein
MRVPRSRRGERTDGFTLVETIATIGLIAVIASFVIPSVVQKAGSGDPLKLQNDLTTVRTAIEAFATDVKAGLPHQISSLTSRPTAGVDRLIDSTAMTTGQAEGWRGPYISATVGSAPGDSLASGNSAYIMSFLERYDARTNAPEHSSFGNINPAFRPSKELYAAVQVHTLTLAQARALNRLYDGLSDTDQPDSSNTTGRFRWPHPSAPGLVPVAYYLAAPIP